jgi:uncharacterized membrane protein YidH (DUF202 family)
MDQASPAQFDSVVANEVQLILAEKRTALSVLRVGIAVMVLPVSVLSVLVTTSRFYDPTQVVSLFVALMGATAGLMGLGLYLIVHSIRRIHRYERMVRQIKIKHSAMAEFIE